MARIRGYPVDEHVCRDGFVWRIRRKDDGVLLTRSVATKRKVRVDLLIWYAKCRECGAEFEISCRWLDTLKSLRRSVFARRNCEAHRETLDDMLSRKTGKGVAEWAAIRREGLELIEQGYSNAVIGMVLGVSRQAIFNWRKAK